MQRFHAPWDGERGCGEAGGEVGVCEGFEEVGDGVVVEGEEGGGAGSGEGEGGWSWLGGEGRGGRVGGGCGRHLAWV